MSITNKGKKWETRNSLWLIWTFIIFLNWIAFILIGGRAKQPKWALFGCLYLALCLLLPVVYANSYQYNIYNLYYYQYNFTASMITTLIFLVAWIASIIHAFFCRREYLIRLEALEDNQKAAYAAYQQQNQNRYPQQFGHPQQQGYPQPNAYVPIQQNAPPVNQPPNLHQNYSQPPVQPPIIQQNYSQPPVQPPAPVLQTSQTPVQKINLNTATEQQLASLPGVGVALAKRAVEARSQSGGFVSVQDFNQRLGLMPHFAVQIERFAFVEPMKTPVSRPINKVRVVDI